MRWIDVKLPPRETCPETDRLLVEARTLAESIPALQERQGLDTPAVLHRIEQTGHLLFRAVTVHDPAAFRPGSDREGGRAPACGCPEIDQELGYHLVTPPDRTGLPWHWLHSGVSFLLESGPICAAEHGSRVPEIDPPRPWMQRHSHALFADEADRPERRTCPEILFVPGHGRDEVRRLIFREAEGIDHALQAAAPAAARLRIPGAVTPGLLAARAMLYQGLHFAAPTSQPPEVSRAGENRWLAGLMAAASDAEVDAAAVDDLVGLEPEILGVDPIDAALDQATIRHASRGGAAARDPASAGPGTAVAAGWLLEDGAVVPERLGRGGGLPALVFSNSWCSLAWLGQRFRAAGASTFVGTAIPVFSRPARVFAALYYQYLSSGLSAAGAHRQACLALRERLGPEHPAWLAHGLQGYGSLRLIDL
jgi:hypothetical protein